METVIRFVTLTARRDKLFPVLLVALLAVALLASFLGSTALVEQRELAVSYAAWSTRLTVAVGLIVFVCFHVRQAFDSREIEVMLSRPMSRARIVLGYWLGFGLVGTAFVLASTVLVGIFGSAGHKILAVWGVTLWLEMLLVVAMALFCAFTLRSAVSAVMSALGLYLMGRMAAFFLLMTDKPIDLVNSMVSVTVSTALKAVTYCMPRLDLFAASEWLVYPPGLHGLILPCMTQVAIYLPVLLAATILDFRKREF